MECLETWLIVPIVANSWYINESSPLSWDKEAQEDWTPLYETRVRTELWREQRGDLRIFNNSSLLSILGARAFTPL